MLDFGFARWLKFRVDHWKLFELHKAITLSKTLNLSLTQEITPIISVQYISSDDSVCKRLFALLLSSL